MKVATGVSAAQPNAPTPYARPPQSQQASREFSTGLFDCCSDMSLCCKTCWCPCITFGQIADIVDKGSSSCGLSGSLYGLLCFATGCQWIYSCTYRPKLKAQYGIPENHCGDCCAHFFCERCALCQEYRELEHLGYHVALGWNENMARQNQGVEMPPQMPGGMMR